MQWLQLLRTSQLSDSKMGYFIPTRNYLVRTKYSNEESDNMRVMVFLVVNRIGNCPLLWRAYP